MTRHHRWHRSQARQQAQADPQDLRDAEHATIRETWCICVGLYGIEHDQRNHADILCEPSGISDVGRSWARARL
jgi:hypothetical protein